ncbi:MAG TPA: Rad52/Rad22 family DNA repair protein [Anaerolineales bacterium]|nr:Rad52/Rad22 family DNA repair protein [Anaerolineales bacterium]
MGEQVILTREMLSALRTPFSAGKLSFKVQTKPSEKGNALVVAYLDARDVMDRLDEVAGPDWSDRYERLEGGKGLICYLTVCGITRADVGDDNNENEPAKSAFSDAFKRAAVKFGVGRFLYDLPKMWAQVKPAGKAFVLADGELEKLQRQVDGFLAGRKTPNSAPAARPPAGQPIQDRRTPSA